MKNFELNITNPEKIVYGDITKLDVINYYLDIAPLMLKNIDKRLLTVIRCHDGIDGECFFKKHPNQNRKYVKIKLVDNEEYFYITNLKGLLSEVQLGTIEFHIWGSKVQNLDRPNLMVFDLDPDENLTLNVLRQAVLMVKKLLDELNLKSYLKTSGGKGYHILVPISKKMNWEEFSELSKKVALLLEAKYPKIFTTNIRKDMRAGKIFVDYLRNKKGATCVSAFSLRARENLPISMPISWEQLNKIKPNQVNIKNYKTYLKKCENSHF